MDRYQTAVHMRKVADRLAEHDPEDFFCCGITLRPDGLCRHRDHHATPFNPYDLEPLVTVDLSRKGETRED